MTAGSIADDRKRSRWSVVGSQERLLRSLAGGTHLLMSSLRALHVILSEAKDLDPRIRERFSCSGQALSEAKDLLSPSSASPPEQIFRRSAPQDDNQGELAGSTVATILSRAGRS